MTRIFPRSLFGQTIMIMLAGLILSQAVGAWLYSADREEAVRAVGGFTVAERIANLTHLVREAPNEWRERIVSAVSDSSFRVSLSDQPPALTQNDDPASAIIRQFLINQGARGGQEPRISLAPRENPSFGGFRRMGGHGPMWQGGHDDDHHDYGRGALGRFRDLAVAMPLPDGRWLNFATALPDSGPAFSRQFLISMAVMALIIIGVSVWVVRRVTAPLSSLAMASERLGRDVSAPPLPETGTIETRQASRAFNTMQIRVRNLIDNRTRLLAAISHDLRTPLTLLRLRADGMEDKNERDKMIATIADMDAMIDATLRFARDEASAEIQKPTDVTSLVQSIADDMKDAGLPVAMQAASAVICECRPAALKRAFTNLIDNAVKYGKSARISVVTDPAALTITIDDDGPGIPESELSRVLEPFYRVEASRSRDTGGVGLGLAIAQSIIMSNGGELRLANRVEGGLRASVILPRTPITS